MPKYYRFRPTSPTRKAKRRDKDLDHEIERDKYENEMNGLGLDLACAPVPSWYLRRTSWREFPPLIGIPRQLAADLRASVQINNRRVFLFKYPTTRSQDWMNFF